jgi:hypothetical protein
MIRLSLTLARPHKRDISVVQDHFLDKGYHPLTKKATPRRIRTWPCNVTLFPLSGDPNKVCSRQPSIGRFPNDRLSLGFSSRPVRLEHNGR